jgi:hypothetical protein
VVFHHEDTGSYPTDQKQSVITTALTTPAELIANLRRAVEDRSDMVVSTFQDDAGITGRGKYAGWHRLIASLDTVDRVVVADAGNLPGRTVADLLKVLGILRDRGATLHLHNIETGNLHPGGARHRSGIPPRQAHPGHPRRAGEGRGGWSADWTPASPDARPQRHTGRAHQRWRNSSYGSQVQRQSGVRGECPAHHAGRAMHILLIVLAVMILFPALARLVGSIMIWTIVVVAIMAILGMAFR